MLYKQALDLFGLKNLLDYKQDKDWFNEILNDPRGNLINRGMNYQMAYGGPAQGRTRVLAEILRNVRDRIKGTKSYAPGDIYTSYNDFPLKNAVTAPDRKNITVFGGGVQHPAILAHEIGHTAQKNLALKSRQFQQWIPGMVMWSPILMKRLRAKLDKDYDPSKFDTTDIATSTGTGLLNGLASWIAGTNIIKSELNASGRALRYLKNATPADLPHLLRVKGLDYKSLANSPLFGQKVIKESKPLLRNALKTYKRGRLVSSLLAAVGPTTVSGLHALYKRHQKNKASQPSK